MKERNLLRNRVSVQLSLHAKDKESFPYEDRMTVPLILAAQKLDQ